MLRVVNRGHAKQECMTLIKTTNEVSDPQKADVAQRGEPVTTINARLPASPAATGRLLTAAQYQRLADVPPELEWFANLDNPAPGAPTRTRCSEFMRFTGIVRPEEFRSVTRAHVIAWRNDLAAARALSGRTVRHRLAALSSLFEYLCERNAVTHNPVKGVKRPKVESYEGKTPALGDHQARGCSAAPDGDTLKGKRDRAILSRCSITRCGARSCAS